MLPSTWAKLVFFYDTIYVLVSSIPGMKESTKRKLRSRSESRHCPTGGYIAASELMALLDSATDKQRLQTDLDNLTDWPLVTVVRGTRAVHLQSLVQFLRSEIAMDAQRTPFTPWALYPPMPEHVPQKGFVVASYAQLIVDLTRSTFDLPGLHWMTEFYDVCPRTRQMTLGARTLLVSRFGTMAMEWKTVKSKQYVRPLCKEGSDTPWRTMPKGKAFSDHIEWEFDDLYPSPTDADVYVKEAATRRANIDMWRIQETGMTNVAKRAFRNRQTTTLKRARKRRARVKEPAIMSQKTLVIDQLPGGMALPELTEIVRPFEPIEVRVACPKAIVSLKTAMGAQRARSCLQEHGIVSVFAVL